MRLHHRICLGIAFLAVLSACSKKPQPDPSTTVIGQSPTRPDFTNLPDKGPSFDGGPAFQDDLASGEGLFERNPNFDILNGERFPGMFPTIYFDFDQSYVRPDDRSTLEQVADSLRSAPSDYLLIEGFCDWKGTTEYNLALGDRRATSVKDYIVSLGIDPSRVEILSKGDLEADTNAGAEGRALDRKAELIIVR